MVLPAAPGLAQDSADIAARVTRIEAEIAELKAMVGRLESLLTAKPSLPPSDAGIPPHASADDLASRVSALETQIGALTSELERLGGQASVPAPMDETAPLPITPTPDEPVGATPAPDAPPERNILDVLEDAVSGQDAEVPAAPPAADDSDPSKPRWYGPRPGEDANAPQSITPPDLATGTLPDEKMPQSLAALPDSDAQALYEQGYGDFLQHDYPGAEKAFSKLVAQYPKDPLAGSAQYWVGETYFLRGQHKKAADAFLAGYRKYSGGDKAPDTLLKLGMSLTALGEKDAACSTFKELGDRFPKAPDHVRDQAKGESKKAGC
ncbi:MAG: tol-pal system protein YbgF [Methyloceanibacter sp.]|uniref:tol-pal system protein YbgF n=1 Tax=Methyloceanibacter sp. TaxID=1965321 RepID=UPI003D6D70E4